MDEPLNLDAYVGSIALGTYLSEYPTDLPYDEVMALMEDKDSWGEVGERVLVWEKFEDESPRYVSTHISDLHDSLVELLKKVTNPLLKAPVGVAQVEALLELVKKINTL